MKNTVYKLCVCLALMSLVQCKMLDLTHPLNGQIPRLPFLTGYNLTTVFNSSYGAYWFLAFDMSMSEHTGTHVDAPAHTHLGGMAIDEIPPEKLVSPAVVIDITQKAISNPDATLDIEDIQEFENVYGRIPQKTLVIVSTGGYKLFWDHKAYFGSATPEIVGTYHFPAFGAEAVQWLIRERDINGVGLDRLSSDPGNSTELPVHVMLASSGCYSIENMNNVGLLPPVGATVSVMPLLLHGGSGSPARVMAFLDGGEMILGAASGAVVVISKLDTMLLCFSLLVFVLAKNA